MIIYAVYAYDTEYDCYDLIGLSQKKDRAVNLALIERENRLENKEKSYQYSVAAYNVPDKFKDRTVNNTWRKYNQYGWDNPNHDKTMYEPIEEFPVP